MKLIAWGMKGNGPPSYDLKVLEKIARQVDWNAIHGPRWMKAGRFRPGPGLGDLQRERQRAKNEGRTPNR